MAYNITRQLALFQPEMKPDQIYNELIETGRKIRYYRSPNKICRKSNIKATSGFCIVKGQKRFIIDNQLNIHKKIDLLASFLSTLPHESIYHHAGLEGSADMATYGDEIINMRTYLLKFT